MMSERFAISNLTGGQLNALVKCAGGEEIVRRVLRGELYLLPIIDAWKRINIGGVRPDVLYDRLRMDYALEPPAYTFMQRRNFRVQKTKERIELAVLAVNDFVSPFQARPTEMFLNEAYLAEWSKNNERKLPTGYVLELLPPEAGPFLRENLQDQAESNELCIAMKPVSIGVSGKWIFSLSRDSDRRLSLGMKRADPKTIWPLGTRFVLRLRQVAQ